MNSIQDVGAFALRLYDMVCDYLNGYYDDDDVLAISFCEGELLVEADDPSSLLLNETTETYRFKELVRIGEIGFLEPDGEKLDVIVNGWVFLE